MGIQSIGTCTPKRLDPITPSDVRDPGSDSGNGETAPNHWFWAFDPWISLHEILWKLWTIKRLYERRKTHGLTAYSEALSDMVYWDKSCESWEADLIIDSLCILLNYFIHPIIETKMVYLQSSLFHAALTSPSECDKTPLFFAVHVPPIISFVV